MKPTTPLLLFLTLCTTIATASTHVGQSSATSPDGQLTVTVSLDAGIPRYSITYRGVPLLEPSPLGFVANEGDFSRHLHWIDSRTEPFESRYTLNRIKHSEIHCRANRLTVTLADSTGRRFDIRFHVANNDVALRYELPRWGETGSVVILREATGFNLPDHSTTFLTPQSDAMIGWKRTKPSYEEEYEADAPLGKASTYGHGYTFPALFRVGDQGWVLLCETGVDSRYCASRLSEGSPEGLYRIEFPMPGENNGNGTSEPGFALPGVTPWRTITVGDSLRPIVETTVMWDIVEPRYASQHDYRFGRGTWSWIIWQDNSINFDDQIAYIDLAARMGYEYVLIDCGWDIHIGRERIAELIRYAAQRHVGIFLWYSSSGYWNDIVQSPTGRMDDPIVRKREMRWLRDCGVKGIKVDFFGGDKQETMRLYEAILSDADDCGLMVLFHGCTLPRGWERMYPNYIGSEAVLASENLVFQQHFDDREAFNATLHPFIRNTVGCMEFGGVVLNRRLNRTNDGGTIRRTTDAFELATGILFQNPVQFFALTPANLTDAPARAIQFMKEIPTTWDETRYVAGYPGQYAVLARRSGNRWYIAGVNARDEVLTLDLSLPMLKAGQQATRYADDRNRQLTVEPIRIGRRQTLRVTIQPQGGMVLVAPDYSTASLPRYSEGEIPNSSRKH